MLGNISYRLFKGIACGGADLPDAYPQYLGKLIGVWQKGERVLKIALGINFTALDFSIIISAFPAIIKIIVSKGVTNTRTMITMVNINGRFSELLKYFLNL